MERRNTWECPEGQACILGRKTTSQRGWEGGEMGEVVGIKRERKVRPVHYWRTSLSSAPPFLFYLCLALISSFYRLLSVSLLFLHFSLFLFLFFHFFHRPVSTEPNRTERIPDEGRWIKALNKNAFPVLPQFHESTTHFCLHIFGSSPPPFPIYITTDIEA